MFHVKVEIDTFWNVKSDRINRKTSTSSRRNRYILECKDWGKCGYVKNNIVEIDTFWNVKEVTTITVNTALS